MSATPVARGPGIGPEILAAASGAVAEAVNRYGETVKGAHLFAEDLGKNARRSKQLNIRIDFERGGRLLLHFSAEDWKEILNAIPEQVDHAVFRELERRWEPAAV